MKKYLGKLISLTLCAGLLCGVGVNAVGNEPVSADTVAPYYLGSVVSIGDGDGGRNVAASSFEAVNLTVTAAGGGDSGYEQYVDYEFTLENTDFSNATALTLQIGNSFWGGVAVNVMIMDVNGTCFRIINNWAAPDVNQAAGKCAQTFSATLGGEVTQTTYSGYGFQNIPGPYAGYMELQLSDFELNWAGTTSDFDFTNVTKVIVELDTLYNPYTKVNIGNMYVKKGNEYTQVYDVTKATVGFGTANMYGKWGDEDANKKHVTATKLAANEIRTKAYYTTNNSQWSPFFMLMPMDISAYNGISYYVDNSANTNSVFFNKFVREYQNNVTGEEWYCDGGYATYTPEEGEAFVDSANIIPAGFKGTITVPFTNFALPGWETVENGVFDLDCVFWNFGFTFDVSQGECSFLIKDFKLVADAKEFVRTTQETTWYGDTKVVLPMDYHDDFDLTSDWTTSWNLASEATFELVDSPASNVVGANGKAMKFTCGAMKSVTGASNETAVEHYPQGEQKNIAGAKGITYYIKNSSASQIGFNFGFDLLVAEGTQQRWTTKMNARYTLVDVNTGKEVVRNGKNGIYVPAGFEGWVRIDFTQFNNPTWETNGTAFSDTFQVAYMVINMNALLHEAESFILDSIGYYYTETSISTTFAASEYDILKAMNTAYNG